MQKVQLIGRLGADPDVRQTTSGIPVANVRLATNENYTNKQGDKVTHTEWHRIVFFSRMAETMGAYAKSGRLIYVEGKNRTRKYTDKDGIDRYVTEIVATNMNFLDSKPDKGVPDTSADIPLPDEEVPF